MPPDFPHSRLGTASLWTGVPAFVVFLIALAVALKVIYARGGGGALSSEGIVLNLTFLAVFVTNIVGVGLGIFGLRERATRKTFPVLGILLNLAPVGIFTVGCLLAFIFD